MTYFEYLIFTKIKKDYEKYIQDNKEIYENTKKYLKRVEYISKLRKKLAFINEEIEKFKNDDINYKNRLVTHNSRPFVIKLAEHGLYIGEELTYIQSQIINMKFDMDIYNQYRIYEVEIHRLDKEIKEIEKNFDLEYDFLEKNLDI